MGHQLLIQVQVHSKIYNYDFEFHSKKNPSVHSWGQ